MTTWLNVKNNAQSALYAGITAAVTSLTLLAGEGAKFPASNFNISIDDEILLCTTRTVDVLTVTRAQEGTTAAIHAVGATVTLNVTANIDGFLDDTPVDNQLHKAPTSNALFDHAALAPAHGGREKLVAARTYYVRTDGSDSNTGLVNSAGGAFLTVQKAIDTAATLDSSIYNVTIQIVAGTYAISTALTAKNMVGAGSITIIGDETTPSNIVIDATGCNVFSAVFINTLYALKGFKLKSTAGTCTLGLYSSNNSDFTYQNLEFGTGITQHIRCSDGGSISCTGNYTVSGGASNHFCGVNGSFRVQGVTITLTGTPAFSDAFVNMSYGSVAIMSVITFSGSATGPRYSVAMNGVLYTGNGGANYFPGNSAGAAATGGQYL